MRLALVFFLICIAGPRIFQISQLVFKDAAPLGEGHFGQVVHATLTYPSGNTVTVAVKGNRKQDLEADYSELRAFSVPSHKNIVRFMGIIPQRGGPLFVMQYADGGSLFDLLKDKTQAQELRLSPGRVVRLLTGIANGLLHVHAHKFVHRDVAASCDYLVM